MQVRHDDHPNGKQWTVSIEMHGSSRKGSPPSPFSSTIDLHTNASFLSLQEGGGVDLLFHTNTESGKTDDLHNDPKINIAFLDPSGQWASISGEASILTDRSTVKKYYSPSLKAWLGDLGDGTHDGGPDDPRIGVIKVTAQTATYAINSKNMVSRAMEVAKGTVTGESAQVNKLRELSTDELKQCKFGSCSKHRAVPHARPCFSISPCVLSVFLLLCCECCATDSCFH